MTRLRRIAAAAALAFALAAPALLSPAAIPPAWAKPKDVMHPCPVVVELYTSQGCNTCPPADALLEALDERADVIGLSLHIDYWDYLGWKDAFALPQNAPRQRAYARTMAQSYVYTPQAVIDGYQQATGSHRDALEAAILAAKEMATVGLRSRWEGPETVLVELPASGSETVGPALARGAALLLLGVDDLHEVPVERGENAGKTLRYSNVVRSFDRIGEWDGMAGTLRIDAGRLRAAGRDKAVLLIQAPEMGRIIGAIEIDLDEAPPT